MTSISPGCYGKLPIHGDFIRHRAGDPEIDALDQWLQAGILTGRQAAGASFDAAWDATPPLRFLFRSPQTKRILAGVLAASVDKAGRRFPFLVFGRLDLRPGDLDASLLPILASRFLQQAQTAVAGGWSGKDLKGVQSLIDGLAQPLDPAGARRACLDYVSGTSSAAFWGGIFGAADDPRRYLLVQNYADVLAPRAIPRYVLRIPRGPGGESEVSFWLELGRRLNRGPELPTLTAWGEGGLTILMDDLQSKYFLPVLWPGRENQFLYPLAGDGAPADARLRLARERHGAALDEPGMLLSTLLLRLSAR